MYVCAAVTLDQLLSLRDDKPVPAEVAQHVRACAECARELSRLRELRSALRQLPILKAPPYTVSALRPHAQTGVWRGVLAAGVGAVAAGICAAIVVGFAPQDATPPTTKTTKPDRQYVIAALVTRSQDLESQLQRLPKRPYVERAGTTATIDSLQARIQQVDYQLSYASADEAGVDAPEAVQLWQDRVRLMDSLVKVRYAEAQRLAVLQ